MTTIERQITSILRGRTHGHGPLTHGSWVNLGHQTVRPTDHYDWDGLQRGGLAHKPFWLFQWTLKGWGWLERSGSRKQVPVGTAFSVKIPSRHRYHADPACEEWSFLWAIISHPYIVERIMRIPQLHNQTLPLTEESTGVMLAFRALAEGFVQEQSADPHRLEILAMTFAYEVERCAFLANHPLAARDALLEKMRGLGSQELSMTDLARNFGMSRTHFAHYFRKTTGESPAAYLKKQRLRQVETLLASSHLSVKEIAAEAGFTDANHLCKAFRAHFQCSPGDYRRIATSSLKRPAAN